MTSCIIVNSSRFFLIGPVFFYNTSQYRICLLYTSDIYGATSSSVLMEYFSPEEILDSSEEDLIAFLAKKSRNRIKDISKTADLLKKAARDSYRLDKALYEPLNVSIASSFNCIETFKREIKVIDNAIEKEIKRCV